MSFKFNDARIDRERVVQRRVKGTQAFIGPPSHLDSSESLINFSGREVGVSLLEPAANQRFSRLLLLMNQAAQSLQLLLELFHTLLEKPIDGFSLLDSDSAQTARL